MFPLEDRRDDGTELLRGPGDVKVILLFQILIERIFLQNLRINFIKAVPRQVSDFDHQGIVLGRAEPCYFMKGI